MAYNIDQWIGIFKLVKCCDGRAGMGEIEILAFYATFNLFKWREN